MKNVLLPVLAGKKGLDIAGSLVSGINERSLRRLDYRYQIELGKLHLAAKALDIIGRHLEEENRRKQIELEIRDRRERHGQFMETVNAFQEGVKAFRVTELPSDKQDNFHQVFLEIIRKSPCLR